LAFSALALLTASDSAGVKLIVAVLAFFAGLLPTVYRALKFDDNVGLCATQASEFKNLQDRFRQCAKISSLKPFMEFDAEFSSLMKRLEKARRPSYTPPEWSRRTRGRNPSPESFRLRVTVRTPS
jgi:hypothetical protein